MKTIDLSLSNLNELFPADFTQEQLAKAKTLFLKELSLTAHKFYGGKIVTMPKAGVYGFNWFNVWYTPGVSAVSTTIRDDHDTSFDLSQPRQPGGRRVRLHARARATATARRRAASASWKARPSS